MIEFWNVAIALAAGLIARATLHSAWLHSRQRKEFERKHDH